MQLVSAARSRGMELTVAQVFQSPVLRDLYKCVEQNTSLVNGNNGRISVEEVDPVKQKEIKDILRKYQVGAIFEATDFQALAISEHTVGNAGLVMYMTIAFNQKVEKSLVRSAYQHAVDTTEMMRVAFVQYDDRVYQAILNSFTGPFEECVSSQNLVDFCESLIKDERRKALALNEPPLKSWFVEGASSDTLIIRLSHAQYDGLSLPLLLQQLKGHSLDCELDGSKTREMSYYSAALQSLDKSPSINYWRGLLAESTMPILPTRPSPERQRMTGNAVRSVIPSFKNLRAGTTSATYVKAAWAIALARLCGRTDVVFGQLVSGRSVPIKGIEDVVGPCVNFVPIRVNTGCKWETVLDQLQAQQVSTLPHEHLGFETVFKECTNWPLDEHQRPRFSTILQYQNQPDACHSTTMHGAECQITYEATPANITDVWAVVEPQGDKLHIIAGYLEEVIDSTTVQRLLDYFVEALRGMQEGKAI
ncbi:hypothetical protein PVAG01_00022 [Phlyctema vagabunda]|uniref:Condensation domain-containing protein n=1 Tax=Phlyctema vagabunda TaxID=108571 RepID=A0ABR4PT13_9HELO